MSKGDGRTTDISRPDLRRVPLCLGFLSGPCLPTNADLNTARRGTPEKISRRKSHRRKFHLALLPADKPFGLVEISIRPTPLEVSCI